MGFLDGATVTADRFDVSPYGANGIQFDVDITAVRGEWSWHWKSHRTNSSSHAMPELRKDPTLTGLIAMLNREEDEAQAQAQARESTTKEAEAETDDLK